jgi:uridine kinase
MLDTREFYNDIEKVITANGIRIIGIDGLGGAGKSTISEEICQYLKDKGYHTILLHIDDFIHVREIRYNSAYPDWHCYYNLQWRFDYFRSVIDEIKKNAKDYIDIDLYNKDEDTYYQQRFTISDNMIIIVEGIFLQRKEYHNIFDYVVYLDIPEDIRLQRVLKRDTYIGDEQQIIDKYERRYFPAQHKYLEECQPQKNANFILYGA